MAIRNEPLAFRLCGMESELVKPCGRPGRRLPATLILPPGRYTVHSLNYNLTREGLYRFLNPGVENRQRIIFRKDPVALLSAISWLAAHGSRDDSKSIAEWKSIAQREKVIITCGSVAKMGVQLLHEQGIPARVVQSKTLAKLNTYDNGHVMMEAWIGGQWVLVDLDVKVMFLRKGKRLSLLEFAAAALQGDYKFERISAATGIAVGCFVENNYDYGLFMESAFCNEACLRRWYKRVMMLPLLRAGDEWFISASPADARKAAQIYGAGRKLVCLPRREFVRRFYGAPAPR